MLARTEIPADGIASQGERKPRFFMPPDPKVYDLVQSFFRVGQLPFVNQEASIGVARPHDGDDLIKRDDLVLEILLEKFQGEEGSRHRPGNGDRLGPEIAVFPGFARHDHRAIGFTHTCPGCQEGILVCQIRVGMDRDGCNLEFSAQGPLVQTFDVLERVCEVIRSGVELVCRERVKHEGIVGIRAVRHSDFDFHSDSRRNHR